MSEYRQGFLRGKSTRSVAAKELLAGEYDLVVLSSSWDRRSVCIAKACVTRASHSILFLFDVRDNEGLRDSHDAILKTYTETSFRKHGIVSGDSSDFRKLWRNFTSLLTEARLDAGRPLRILIDLSACPRFFSLGMLAWTMRHGLAASVSFFYAEGRYPEEANVQDRHELFTTGGWDAVAIPGLEGKWDPEKDRMYFVSVGFEGSKTLRLVSREEPDRVSVLFPDPPVQDGYQHRTWENNKPLFDAFRIKRQDIVCAPAGDAISTWEAIAASRPENHSPSNMYYVCCGTKPHSLALALDSLVLQTPAVLYIAPDRHRVVDIAPQGVFWRFDVSDVTSF